MKVKWDEWTIVRESYQVTTSQSNKMVEICESIIFLLKIMWLVMMMMITFLADNKLWKKIYVYVTFEYVCGTFHACTYYAVGKSVVSVAKNGAQCITFH